MTGTSGRRGLLFPLVAAVISVGGFIGVWRFTHAPVPAAPTIVVFPVADEPADTTEASLGDQLAAAVAALPGVQLRGTDAVHRPRTSRLTPREIARAVGASWVLTGTRVGSVGATQLDLSLVEVETGARTCCTPVALSGADLPSSLVPALARALGLPTPTNPLDLSRPRDVRALVARAETLLIDSAGVTAATALVDQALRRDSNTLDGWLLRARVTASAGDFAAATEAARRARLLDALSPRAWLTTAQVLAARGLADSAATAAERAVTLSGDDPAIRRAALTLSGR